jgi:signal transduction histidine kinase
VKQEAGLSSGTPDSCGQGFEVLLSGGPDAGFEARQAIRAGDGSLAAGVREDVLLLVTELVTNAVRHAPVGADQSLRVAVQMGARRVRVEVSDPGARIKPARPRRSDRRPLGRAADQGRHVGVVRNRGRQ